MLDKLGSSLYLDQYEEIDMITKGGNYGWSIYKGPYPYKPSNATKGSSCSSNSFILPVMGYNHSEADKAIGSASITGGAEPTRAQIFLLTHKQRKDGRPLDADSANAIEMINERMNNSESFTDQPPRSVAWEGDVYSQVLGNDKSGYVRGLGLGPTPSVLWGSRSSLGNIVAEDSFNEAVQRLTQEITELKDKHNEEMNLMKQNQEKMQSELLQVLMRKYVSNESMPQNINGTSSEQVADANSGHKRVAQTSRIPSVAENTSVSRYYSSFEFSSNLFIIRI